MGQTPDLNLPYPDLSDAPNVPADMKALADRLETLLQGLAQPNNPIQVIDPVEADFGWNDLPRGWTSGAAGTSGAGNTTSWDNRQVLNAGARWRFTAPSDGVLKVDAFWHMGYNNLLENDTVWQEFRLQPGTISGNAVGVHTNYAKWRVEGGPNDKSEISDDTLVLSGHFIVSKGAVLSPYVAWRGKTRYEDGQWRPKWSGGRMQGLFIPGPVQRVDPPSNNSTTPQIAKLVGGEDPEIDMLY